jgi:hypothetical protein
MVKFLSKIQDLSENPPKAVNGGRLCPADGTRSVPATLVLGRFLQFHLLPLRLLSWKLPKNSSPKKNFRETLDFSPGI